MQLPAFTGCSVCGGTAGLDHRVSGVNVTLATPNHPFIAEERAYTDYPNGCHALEYAEPITIGDHCWLCAGATVCGGVTITGLAPDTLQGDAAILDILRRCGAVFTRTAEGISFEKAPLHGVDIDLADCPDLGPVLMVLGLLCEGTTVIRNAERLRLKESDRIAAMEAELRAVGGLVESEGGTITVQGCADRLHAPAGVLHGHNDHRVVMSLAVLSLATGIPLTVDDAEAITKSWPNFFEAIKPLGAEVEHVG